MRKELKSLIELVSETTQESKLIAICRQHVIVINDLRLNEFNQFLVAIGEDKAAICLNHFLAENNRKIVESREGRSDLAPQDSVDQEALDIEEEIREELLKVCSNGRIGSVALALQPILQGYSDAIPAMLAAGKLDAIRTTNAEAFRQIKNYYTLHHTAFGAPIMQATTLNHEHAKIQSELKAFGRIVGTGDAFLKLSIQDQDQMLYQLYGSDVIDTLTYDRWLTLYQKLKALPTDDTPLRAEASSASASLSAPHSANHFVEGVADQDVLDTWMTAQDDAMYAALARSDLAEGRIAKDVPPHDAQARAHAARKYGDQQDVERASALYDAKQLQLAADLYDQEQMQEALRRSMQEDQPTGASASVREYDATSAEYNEEDALAHALELSLMGTE